MSGTQGRLRAGATAVSRAAPSIVFGLVKDGPSWPVWSSFTGFELERPGATEPLGLGAIRVNKTQVTTAREEVVELVPDRRFSYILLSGMPMLNYRGDVDLEPTPDGGTRISWRSSFDPKYGGTGWFWRLFMNHVLSSLTTQLAKAADAKAGG